MSCTVLCRAAALVTHVDVYLQSLVVVMAGDIELCCHVHKVITNKLGVSVESFFYDTQSCSQIITLIITPKGEKRGSLTYYMRSKAVVGESCTWPYPWRAA